MPDRFINRNSGITITCIKCDVDDNNRTATLTNASIINGAQTQGEIKRYFAEPDEDGSQPADFLVRCEIIMEPSHDQIVEIAIARNTATSVKSVPQAGAQLTDLKASIEAALPGETLQMSETDIEGLNTQSVLQCSRLLMPERLLGDKAPGRNFAYKQGGKCLADFGRWAQVRNSDQDAKRLYEFTVQIAPIALQEYRRLERHDGWNTHRLHEKGKFEPTRSAGDLFVDTRRRLSGWRQVSCFP